MKKILWLYVIAFAAILLGTPLPAKAQGGFTTVTGTITDLSGLAYSCGTISAQLITAGGAAPTLNGGGFTTVSAPVQLGCPTIPSSGAPGSFVMRLADSGVISPSNTTWRFTINMINEQPPLGTGPQTFTYTSAINCSTNTPAPCTNNAMDISSLLAAIAPSLSSGNLNSLNTTGVTLSQTCGKAVAPCIQIPPSGGCITGAVTNGTGLVTFTGAFPSPTPIVGEVAWVTQENGAGPGECIGSNGDGTLWGATNICGGTGSGQITITAVNPGASVTLSQNCSTQNGTNAWLFYGPNIFAQMNAACKPNGPGGVIQIAQGFYILDNSGNGTTRSCGDGNNHGGFVVGAGLAQSTAIDFNPAAFTSLNTPPWYNHGADTGTVIVGAIANIIVRGDWTKLGLPHGTPIYGGCGSHDFKLEGYNFGDAALSESFYGASGVAAQGAGINQGNCVFRDFTLYTGNRGITGINGRLNIINGVMRCQSACFNAYGGAANNGILNIQGGYYEAAGTGGSGTPNTFNFPEVAQSPSGDQLWIASAEVCNTGSAAAVSDQESAGEVRLVNVKLNSSPSCTPGTNTTAVSIASGVTLRMSSTSLLATGTGNTVNNPSGATVIDNCGNTASGGAGYTGTGAYGGPCYTLGPAPAASNIVLGGNGSTTGYGSSSLSAFVTSPVDSRRHFTFTITLAGTLTIALETITYTFPAPFDVAPGTCRASVVGGTQFAAAPYSFLTTTAPTTTSVVFTQQTAAGTAGNTEIIAVDCN